MKDRLMVIAGSSNIPLALEICDCLDTQLTEVAISRFSNDCLFVQILENVRESDVFVVQSLYPNPSEKLVELMLLCDALRSASAGRITAVIPHYSYARSDKKDKPRISIAARALADALVTAGVNRFLTMALHSAQVHGFFSVPTDHLLAVPVICDHLSKSDLSNTVALFDFGEDKRIGSYAERLSLPIAVIEKQRISDTEVEIRALIGDVKDKDVIIFDDEISRGTSLIATLDAIDSLGVLSVRAACTHGLLCGPAIDLIQGSKVEEVIATDTVEIPPEKRTEKITVLSVASLFAEAIERIHMGESVSELFR